MPASSLRDKITLMAKRNGKKVVDAPIHTKPKRQKIQIAEQSQLADRDYDSVNIFADYPGFRRVNVSEFVADDSLDDDEMEGNMQIVLDSIKFLNGLQFEASRINKERLFRKFNHNFPQLVVVDQLYCILPPHTGSETYIDQSIQQLITGQKIKMIDLNNENFRYRLAILTEDFVKVAEASIDDKSSLTHFTKLLEDYPNLLQIDSSLLAHYKLDPTKLIRSGFLTFSRQRSSGGHSVYNISLPNLGPFLKIMNVGIRFVCHVCLLYHQNQVLEKHLAEKYTRNTLVYRRMRGLNLTWLLSVMVGSGLLECFNTPVGRVYHMTGKKM